MLQVERTSLVRIVDLEDKYFAYLVAHNDTPIGGINASIELRKRQSAGSSEPWCVKEQRHTTDVKRCI